MAADGIEFVKALAQAHELTNPPREGDYTEDGLLFCGKCRTAKRARITMGGEEVVVPVWCECMLRADEEERRRSEAVLAQMRASELRSLSLMDSALSECTFEAADHGGENHGSILKCRRYAEKFSEMLSEGRGLLLFGGVGTGKTYSAACIANRLMSCGRSVIMTSLVKLIDGGTEDILRRMSGVDLLILDDSRPLSTTLSFGTWTLMCLFARVF